MCALSWFIAKILSPRIVDMKERLPIKSDHQAEH